MFELLLEMDHILRPEGWIILSDTLGPIEKACALAAQIRWEARVIDLQNGKDVKVMLVCGSDLLESFSTPGVWIPEQVRAICRDFGLVCVRRGGQDVEKIIPNDDILNAYKRNIRVVDEVVPNGISSTRLRDCISKGLSVKYLTADEVIDYIKQHNLYKEQLSNN
ncbi:Nicotinamide/nicotinic acid mononucleotide adenylyltransferase [Capsicum annuum]|nr:Nicotinamide/nicotinic acid mononucleotide adenylyltransferase [Capsicum annuum]KAF3671273.1 Nicotinamide/nicotinic acid mononucleotide adenylyltransferase [Capsicum annuum]